MVRRYKSCQRRVNGPPFLALAAPDAVRTESVAWGVQQTLHTALVALERD